MKWTQLRSFGTFVGASEVQGMEIPFLVVSGPDSFEHKAKFDKDTEGTSRQTGPKRGQRSNRL